MGLDFGRRKVGIDKRYFVKKVGRNCLRKSVCMCVCLFWDLHSFLKERVCQNRKIRCVFQILFLILAKNLLCYKKEREIDMQVDLLY